MVHYIHMHAMVEIDFSLLFAGVGMISMGLISMIYWFSRANFSYFVYVGLLWLLAIGVKTVMDFTVASKLSNWLISAFGKTIVTKACVGLYDGLRTGFFECGFPYLAVLKTKLKEVDMPEAIAFGIEFFRHHYSPSNLLTPTKTLTEMYLIEVPTAVFGLLGIFGVRYMKQKLDIT